MDDPVIFMDYNATAPVRESVMAVMAEALRLGGNPSSVHRHGRSARARVEQARAQVAALAGARTRDVVFMSGGTEANNAALRMTGAASLIISAVEHDCIFAAAKASGLPVFVLPVDRNGCVEIDALPSLLAEAPQPALVSVMLANNETGVIQPVKAVAEIAREAGARTHSDAVQAAGKIDLEMTELGVDYLSLSAHKLGGPQGVGALVLGPTAPLAPLVTGGGQELGRRSGTENVAGIAGFGQAALDALAGLDAFQSLADWRDRIETVLAQDPLGYRIAGAGAKRLANTICAVAPSMKGETQVMALDLAGVCVSSGSACSSGKVKVSHVLSAMGYSEEEAGRSVRISLGYATTEKDVDHFIEAAGHSLAPRKPKRSARVG